MTEEEMSQESAQEFDRLVGEIFKSAAVILATGIKPIPRITALEQVAIYLAMLALLKRLQWSGRLLSGKVENGIPTFDECCPICYGYKEVKFDMAGHLKGCQLGELIQVLEMVLEKPAD